MKHIRYMTSNKPVCEKPDMLGSEFIVLDTSPVADESCDPCLKLVMAHNKREYERDGFVNYPQGQSVSSGASLMEITSGFGLASLFWIIVMFVVVLILTLEC